MSGKPSQAIHAARARVLSYIKQYKAANDGLSPAVYGLANDECKRNGRRLQGRRSDANT
jgi:hypothetical protein